MMKYFFVTVLLLFAFFVSEAQTWELVSGGSDYKIEKAHIVCNSNQGFEYDYIVLRFTNLSTETISLVYNYEEWYNDVCSSCDDQDLGSKRTLQLGAGQVMEGNCSSNSYLKIFDHSITVHPNAFVGRLSNLVISNVEVKR
jgi:hypothetical protein